MRIISGKYKGKTIQAPANLPVRPTTDYAKTGLFNILSNRFGLSECIALDLYSGTGSISLEMISRGLRKVTAVDSDPGCVEFLKKTAQKLEISGLRIIKSDVFTFLNKNSDSFDIIFADPPFSTTTKNELHHLIFEKKIIKNNGVFILEHQSKDNYEDLPGFEFSRSYGNVTFSFFLNFD